MYLEFDGFGSSVDLLIYLLDGKKMASELKNVTGYDTALKIMRKFESAGLITSKIEKGTRTINWFELTPKGRRVAEHLAEAQKIVKEK